MNHLTLNISDFCNWYVVHTLAGSEKKIIDKVNAIKSGNFCFYLPQKEFIHKKQGIEKKMIFPLFPGYFFVNKENKTPGFLLDFFVSHKLDDSIRIVSADNKYLKVAEHEMKRLFKMAGEDGIIRISQGVLKKDDQVKIIRGPLKNFSGKILFVNKRKKKAKVCLNLLNKDVYVTLGLEILSDIHQDYLV